METQKELYEPSPNLFICLRNDLKYGDYVINVHTHYVWRLLAGAKVINKAVERGQDNIQAIMCSHCKERVAEYYNRGNNYMCKKCHSLPE